ncbi:hypothetical protein ACWF94_04570 [Streptomyces sp. NPDC055078]
MLTLRLTPYADDTWQWHRDRYRTRDRRSEIVPLHHPMAEHLAVTDGRRTLLSVRERAAGRPPCDPAVRHLAREEYEQARALAQRWPADYILVETVPQDPVRITAGACRTTPLYLAHDSNTLHGSWDMGDLRPHAQRLNTREAARLLLYRPRYTTTPSSPGSTG